MTGRSLLLSVVGGLSTLWYGLQSLFDMKTLDVFGKYDWIVTIHPNKSKLINEYDVIVVGSGIGGLTSAAFLAHKGFKVLVLEQQEQVGGYCSSFQRDGFVFNVGVSDVSGLWERGAVSYLLKQFGLNRDNLFVKNTRRLIVNGKEYTFTTKDNLINQLLKQFPHEKKQIQAFFDEAHQAYEELHSKENLIYGFPLNKELINSVLGIRTLISYPFSHPTVVKWLTKTYRQKLDAFFKDKHLKRLLSGLLGYVGTPAEKTPALHGLGACLSYFLYGGYYPKGGAQTFSHALKDVVERYGGTVLTRHKVDEIIIRTNNVEGVRVGMKFFKSPCIIANANAKTTFSQLVPQKILPRSFVATMNRLKMSPSAFVIHLGLDLDLAGYPSLISDLDIDCHLIINSSADKTLAPQGKSSVTIYTLSDNYKDIPVLSTDAYKRYKEQKAQQEIRKAEKIIPGLSKHIIVKDIETPKTFERYTAMPQGALYAFDQSIENKRPYFKTPIKGLYLASASTLYGGGIEAVVMSGLACAHDKT